MSEAKVTLGEFGPNRVFYTSVGCPAGEELELEDGDFYLEDRDWCGLKGTVDADGIWRWDGLGEPTDCNRNTVMRVDAWIEASEPKQTRGDAVDMVVKLLQDGQRTDRFLCKARDGEYYVTPDINWIDYAGVQTTTTHVKVPFYSGEQGLVDEQLTDWASDLIDQLDLELEPKEKANG